MRKMPARYKVRNFVVAFIKRHRYSPSYDEIGQRFGYGSWATIHKHIHNLVKEGALEFNGAGSRKIALPGTTKAVCPECQHEFHVARRMTNLEAIRESDRKRNARKRLKTINGGNRRA